MSNDNSLPLRSECKCPCHSSSGNGMHITPCCVDDSFLTPLTCFTLHSLEVVTRAKSLMGQVMKTWDPPRIAGTERAVDIAQTSVMLAISYIMGREFLPDELTVNQRAAIDAGLTLFNKVIAIEAEEEKEPTIVEWMEAYEAAVESGQSRISREEAERRYDQKYGRNRQQNDDY